MAEKSEIQIFFDALGTEAVQRKFGQIAGSTRRLSQATKEMNASGVGNVRNLSRAYDGLAQSSNSASLAYTSFGRGSSGGFREIESGFFRIDRARSRAFGRDFSGGVSQLSSGFGALASSGVRAFGIVGSLVRGASSLFGSLLGTVSSVVGTIRGLGTTAITVSATGLGAVAAGIGSVVKSNADLTKTVLGLRALNDEVDKTGRFAPAFAIAQGGEGAITARNTFTTVYDQVERRNVQQGVVTSNRGAQAGQFIDRNSQARVSQDFAFLSSQADRFGVSLTDLAGNYNQFKASVRGIIPDLKGQQDAIAGINDAAAVLNLGTVQVEGAIRALGQTASKGGRVMAEEVRGQLAEAIPGAISIAAKGLGLTTGEFNKQLEAGLIQAGPFIKAFTNQLRIEYGAAATAASNTTSVAFGRIGNAFTRLKVLIAAGPLDTSVRNLLNSLTALFDRLSKSGAAQRFGELLSLLVDRVTSLINGSDEAVTRFADIVYRFASGALTLLTGVGKGFAAIVQAIQSPVYSDNAFLALLQSGVFLATTLFNAITGFTPGQGFATFSETVRTLSVFFDQLARSIYNVSQGFGADQKVEGLLPQYQSVTTAVNTVASAFERLNGFLTGEASKALTKFTDEAAKGFPNVTRIAGAIGDLLSGKQAPKDGTLEVLFDVRDAAIAIGKGIADATLAVTSMLTAFGNATGIINGTAEDGTNKFTGLGKVIQGLVTFKLIEMLGVFKLIGGAFKALEAVAAVTAAATRAIGLGPVILIVAAIAAAGYLLYKFGDEITTFFGAIWKTVADAFTEAMRGAAFVVGSIIDAVLAPFRAIAGVFSKTAREQNAKRQAERDKSVAKYAAESSSNSGLANDPRARLVGNLAAGAYKLKYGDGKDQQDGKGERKVPNPMLDDQLLKGRVDGRTALDIIRQFAAVDPGPGAGLGVVAPPANDTGLNGPVDRFTLQLPNGEQSSALIERAGGDALAEYAKQQNARSGGPLPQSFGTGRAS